MNTRQIRFLLLTALLSGCASHTQYRTAYELCENPAPEFSSRCDKHAIQQLPTANGSRFLLGFIEFDDQGQLWDRRQMASVTDLLTTEAASKELLMVVFVHGWKHSAAPQDSNIETFRKFLAKLSEDEKYIARQSGRPAREVAGIYLGWRGGSMTLPVLENLTFWDRKNTATKVGHGAVTEVLTRLEQLKRDKDSVAGGSSDTRLIVVGHSFGGLVVHSALNQILESRFIRTTGPAGTQSNVEGFGNLVVLINPAFEAQKFTSASDMSTERGTYFRSQLPALAILTSEADYATRYAFPAGRWLSTRFEKTHSRVRWNAITQREETISEAKANVTAVGHFEPYRTHRLYPTSTKSRAEIAELSSSERVRSAFKAYQSWENDQPDSKILFSELALERTGSSAARNPFLNIYVDKRLIADHNDIDDERVIQFVKDLVLISTVSSEDREPLKKSFAEPQSAP